MGKLSTIERTTLNEMINTRTFFGIPLEDITPDILEAIEYEDARILYIVASMLGWECRDRDCEDSYPYEAEEVLKRFMINGSNTQK
jgi:hypothetical protein